MRWTAVRASVASAIIAFSFPASAEPVRMETIDDELKVLIERSVSERFLDPWSTQFGRLSANLDLAKGTIVTADESGEEFVREKCERDDLELTVWP